MERRRLLLAASAVSRGPSLFPINLIEGDNGEIGVKLFEYIVENADSILSDYTFKDNEGVYVLGVAIEYAQVVSDDMIALESSLLPGSILVIYLFNNGELTIVYD